MAEEPEPPLLRLNSLHLFSLLAVFIIPVLEHAACQKSCQNEKTTDTAAYVTIQ